MKRKISKSVISLILTFAVLISSIPFMSWSAIAQTIIPAVLSAEDDSVAETSADVSVADTGDITVNYPTRVDNFTYVDGNGEPIHWDIAGFASAEDLKNQCFEYSIYGVFDPICYLQIYPDLIDSVAAGDYYAHADGNTITYNGARLYEHWVTYGIGEGRVASPYFCIGCYLRENYDLFVNLSPEKTMSERYKDAWAHFKEYSKQDISGRIYSPIFNLEEYKNMYPDIKLLADDGQPVDYEVFKHFHEHCAYGNELRVGSSRVDCVALYYNNNSLYHYGGVYECYRKLIKEITTTTLDHTGMGCHYHKDYTYTGTITHDTFTGTLTSVGAMRNVAVSADGTEVVSVTPGNTKNELWEFIKQENGAYKIKLSNGNSNLTYDGTETDKYLCVYKHSIFGLLTKLSDQPETDWYIYEVDGLYVLHPDVVGSSYNEVLNINGDNVVHCSRFGNNISDSYTGTNYNAETMDQRFIINTTYDSPADSDGLAADFYASIDAYSTFDGRNSKVSLTYGDCFLRTRKIAEGGTTAADQLWHFVRQNDGTYKIQNNAVSQYLTSTPSREPVINDNVEASGYDYTAVYVTENDNSNEQKWILRKRDDGGYLIMPVVSANQFSEGACLRVVEESGTLNFGSLLYVDAFKGKEFSVFDLSFRETLPHAYDFDGNDEFYAYISSGKVGYENYYIKNSETQYGVEKKFEDATDQDIKKHDYYWKFRRLGDGSYEITSTTTADACLTYRDGKLYLDEISPNDGYNQLWYVYKYNGGYRFEVKDTGEILQMNENGELTAGPVNTNNYDDFQLFNITETDMSIDTAADTFKVNLFNYGSLINDPYDSSHVLDFTYFENNALDRRNTTIASTNSAIPEMSKVLVDNYPYVKNYAYVHTEANLPNGITYDPSLIVTQPHLTPNRYSSGSLQYLFDPSRGFDNGGNTSMTEYNPTAVDGDLYQSQAFKVSNPSGLFQKDENGFYYYNSAKNSVSFDIDENSKTDNGTMSGSFKVYDYYTHITGHIPFAEPAYCGMFMPFNIAHEQGALCYGDGINACDKINYNQKGITGFADIDKANYTMPVLNRNKDNTFTDGVEGDRTKAPDMWFGMTVETDFYQTKDGKLNDQDVKFEFAGDDDVWVYLDGILVLDLGGNPQVVKSEINFADSTVTVPKREEYVSVYDNKSFNYPDGTPGYGWTFNTILGYCEQDIVSLYSLYYDAYEEVKGTDKEASVVEKIKSGFDIDGEELPAPVSVEADPKLRDYAEHNLKFYYLERGGASSNCDIRLNTLSGGTTVSKKVNNLNKEIMATKEYKFKVVAVDANGNESPYADCPYTLSSTTSRSVEALADTDYVTDENGCFTLKDKQKATFGKIAPGSDIKVYEIDEDDAITTQWHTEMYNSETGKKESSKKTLGLETDVVTTPVDKTIDIVFTNNYAPSQYVCIQKGFNEENNSDTYRPDEHQIYVIGYQLINPYGKIVVDSKVTLHQGETYEINAIPVGYKYRIWEYTPDGALNFESPVFTVNSKEEVVKTFVPQGSTPGANSYIEGTISENKDYTVLVTNKLAQRGNIDITFKYYDRTRTNGAPAQINEYYSTYKTVLEPEEWEQYVNTSTQRINFSKMIADQGVYFNDEVAVDNIIDEYVVWTSQQDAEKGFAQQTNYFAGKDENGEYYTYGDTNPDNFAYHTNALGDIANDGEKWVTYYQGGNVIDPETQGNDTDVTAITVWLFNKPKTYTVKMHTVTPDDLSTATVVDGLYVGNKAVTFNAFYNQRIANTPDAGITERDEMNSQNYLDIYNIPENDIITGVDDLGQTVEYLDLTETIVDDSEENKPYTFMYWSYDEQGRTVASTSINYAYRITNDMELYAIYGESPLDTPGLTAFRNCTDYYVDENGTHKVRLNTMMNPYNCPDKDETITDAAILYVMLHGSQQYKNYTEAQLIEALYNTNDEGIRYLDILREDIKNILESSVTKGAVTVVDATLTANGFRYEVESASGATQKLNLSTKNRIQFTTEFSETAIKDKRLLAFTAMNKDNNWIVSDNYVDYDFLNK